MQSEQNFDFYLFSLEDRKILLKLKLKFTLIPQIFMQILSNLCFLLALKNLLFCSIKDELQFFSERNWNRQVRNGGKELFNELLKKYFICAYQFDKKNLIKIKLLKSFFKVLIFNVKSSHLDSIAFFPFKAKSAMK